MLAAQLSEGASVPGVYRDGPEHVAEAADEVGIAGKDVLVIGTQHPWLEAVLYTRRPRTLVTVDYTPIKR